MGLSQNTVNNNSQAFSGNLANGNVTISQLPGAAAFNTQAYLMFIVLGGANLDIRFMYTVSHQGFGGTGFANQLAVVRNFNNTAGAYTFNSISLDASGNIIVNSTISSGSFSYSCRLTPYGPRFLVQNV
jgi:hypothetical protein